MKFGTYGSHYWSLSHLSHQLLTKRLSLVDRYLDWEECVTEYIWFSFVLKCGLTCFRWNSVHRKERKKGKYSVDQKYGFEIGNNMEIRDQFLDPSWSSRACVICCCEYTNAHSLLLSMYLFVISCRYVSDTLWQRNVCFSPRFFIL